MNLEQLAAQMADERRKNEEKRQAADKALVADAVEAETGQGGLATRAAKLRAQKFKQEEEQSFSLGERVIGGLEFAADIGSAVVSDAARLATDLATGNPMAYMTRELMRKAGLVDVATEEQAAAVSDTVADFLNFEPRTLAGKTFKRDGEQFLVDAVNATPFAQEAIQAVGGAVESYRQTVEDMTGSPAVADFAVAFPEALTYLTAGSIPVKTAAKKTKQALGTATKSTVETLGRTLDPITPESIAGPVRRTYQRNRRMARERDLRNNFVETPLELEQVRNARDAAYRELTADGVEMRRGTITMAADFIQEQLDDSGFALTDEMLARLNSVRRADAAIGRTSIDELDNLRRLLYRNIPPNDLERMGAANTAANALDEFIGMLNDTDFTGPMTGQQIRDRLNTARTLSGRVIRGRQINEIFERGLNRPDSTMETMVSDLRRLFERPSTRRFYDDDTYNAMQNIVRGEIQPEVAVVRAVGELGLDIASAPVRAVQALRVFGDARYRQMRLVSPTRTISERVGGRTTAYERAFEALRNQVLSGGDPQNVIQRYNRAVPRGRRRSEELGELLVLAETDIDALDLRMNRLQREAVQYARGVNNIRRAVATVLGPTVAERLNEAAAQAEDEEENNVTVY